MRKSWILISAVAAVLCGQNFDKVTDTFLDHRSMINQKIRVGHAKELLGKYYAGSDIEVAELKEDLPLAIYREIRKRLPDKYKSQARSLARMIMKEAQANDLDPVFVMAMIQTESGFKPQARGTHGEIGLMQLKPSTAEWIAKKNSIPWRGSHTLENPSQNVRIGIAYLSHLRDQMDHHANKYLSAYNIGAKKVISLYAQEVRPKLYTQRVMSNYSEIYKNLLVKELAREDDLIAQVPRGKKPSRIISGSESQEFQAPGLEASN